MKFEISKKEFLKGLGFVQGVTGRRTALPVLCHVLMELKENSLYLTATDLETSIREGISVDGSVDGGICLPARKLYEIVRELPDETIHIDEKENNWITIKCGKSAFNLAGLDPSDFPSLPTYKREDSAQIPNRVLLEMIERTVFAASDQESFHHLNGVLFTQVKQEGKHVLRAVATDGHRLAMIDREGFGIHGIEEGVIIPKKGVLELKKFLRDGEEEGMVDLYFDKTHGFMKMGEQLITVRLIDGEFPEYEQIIPKENGKRVRMQKEKISSSLRRISTMASEKMEGVKIALKNNLLEGSSVNREFGDAREEVEVVYEGPPLEMGFNARYLLEALNGMGTEDVWLELKDEGDPAVLRPVCTESSASSPTTGSDSQLSIIMPMRL